MSQNTSTATSSENSTNTNQTTETTNTLTVVTSIYASTKSIVSHFDKIEAYLEKIANKDIPTVSAPNE